jgi:hypothetical protein
MNVRTIIFAICLFGLPYDVSLGADNTAEPSTANTPLSPGLKVIGLGTQLGHVLEDKESKVQKLTKDQIEVRGSLAQWVTNPNGELQIHVQAGKALDSRCPSGGRLPPPQARACNAEIDAYNVKDAQLTKEANRRNALAEKMIAEKQVNIDRLKAEQIKISSTLDSIVACLDEDVLRRKACLDQLYDNVSRVSSAYDLDPNVVKPGPFGTKQISPEAAIKLYKESGDDKNQIRKVLQKKIDVPKPQ